MLSSSAGPHADQHDYAFDMAASSIRFGRGSTKEVGDDMISLGASKNVCVISDKSISKLPSMNTVLESLHKAGVKFIVFDDVSVEPTDKSMMDAVSFCRGKNFDGFVALGGGSAMDTAKVANLYMCNPDREFLDFVNAPIGRGIPVPRRLKPLVAIPTTAGTGSETSGVAIFDHSQVLIALYLLACTLLFLTFKILPLCLDWS